MWIATHDLDFARRCCDRYALLDAGELREQGDIEDIDSLWGDEVEPTQLELERGVHFR